MTMETIKEKFNNLTTVYFLLGYHHFTYKQESFYTDLEIHFQMSDYKIIPKIVITNNHTRFIIFNKQDELNIIFEGLKSIINFLNQQLKLTNNNNWFEKCFISFGSKYTIDASSMVSIESNYEKNDWMFFFANQFSKEKILTIQNQEVPNNIEEKDYKFSKKRYYFGVELNSGNVINKLYDDIFVKYNKNVINPIKPQLQKIWKLSRNLLINSILYNKYYKSLSNI